MNSELSCCFCNQIFGFKSSWVSHLQFRFICFSEFGTETKGQDIQEHLKRYYTMGKKGSSVNKKGPVVAAYPTSMTLREETSGKKQGFVSAKSTLKMEHMKNLAIWAGNESSIPSLGAFFGHRLAATAEALDVPSDPSLFSCQRFDQTFFFL